MIHRIVFTLWMLVALTALWLLAQPAAAGQTSRSTTALSDSLARTAWGDPDLQGMWDNGTITPIERPGDLADTPFLTEEQVAEREQRAEENRFSDRAPRAGDVGTYNRFWSDRGTRVVPSGQTSLIVDPPDGKLPALQADAAHQVGSLAVDVPGPGPVRYRVGGSGVESPEARGLAERCILGFANGPPLTPGGYNQNI